METEKLVADILFKGGDIITLDRHNPYIRNGAIAVAADKIVAIGAVQEVETQVASANRSVDFSGLLMMPGMVDGHSHLFQSLGKTLGDGMSLFALAGKIHDAAVGKYQP